MENIKFRYLYRDAGNYKNWANVVFRNPDRLALESVTKALQHAFLEECLFIAHQIRIPDAFLFAKGDATSDDHCFHEFGAVEIALDSPNDRHSRSIAQFIADVKKEANRGWMAFDPHNIPSL